MSDRLLTAKELAERWQVKEQWVYAKTRSGEIPKVPLPGRYYRYRLDVIERFERGEHDNPGSPVEWSAQGQSGRPRRANATAGLTTRRSELPMAAKIVGRVG